MELLIKKTRLFLKNEIQLINAVTKTLDIAIKTYLKNICKKTSRKD